MHESTESDASPSSYAGFVYNAVWWAVNPPHAPFKSYVIMFAKSTMFNTLSYSIADIIFGDADIATDNS